MDISGGNRREYATIIHDGKILKSIKGTKTHTPISSELEKIIFGLPDYAAQFIHYHTSGCSFSAEDIMTLYDVRAFSEMRVATPSGWIFKMETTEKTIFPDREKLLKQINEVREKSNIKLMPMVRRKEITLTQKRILESRWICQVIKNKYNWGYQEVPPDGR